jgi:hypothetical protein
VALFWVGDRNPTCADGNHFCKSCRDGKASFDAERNRNFWVYGKSFAFGLCCHGRHSPLRGCSARSASPKAKIPSRSAAPNFQTGSKKKAIAIAIIQRGSAVVLNAE